jgi:hypothetical protein
VSDDNTTTAGKGAVSMGEAPTATSPPPEPTGTVGHGQQTHSHPAGSAMPEGGIPVTERPEALIGGAFAGGLVLALILKRLGR